MKINTTTTQIKGLIDYLKDKEFMKDKDLIIFIDRWFRLSKIYKK